MIKRELIPLEQMHALVLPWFQKVTFTEALESIVKIINLLLGHSAQHDPGFL